MMCKIAGPARCAARYSLSGLTLLMLCTWLVPGAAVAAEATAPEQQVVVERVLEHWTGDLPEIRKGRVIRVLTSVSKTGFFFDEGEPRGFDYELLREYEKQLNAGVKRESERLVMLFIPMAFDTLLDSLESGVGDIVAAGVTITPERAAQVAFSEALLPEVREIVVQHKAIEGIQSLDALAGRTIHVRAGSSYVESLEALNVELATAGREPVDIVEADNALSTEDILELVNAGVIDITVADGHIAELWASVLPDIVIRPDLIMRDKGAIAWAVRKDSPELLADINVFVTEHRQGSLLGNVFFERYYQGTAWIKNPTTDKERAKLERVVELFDHYSGEYGFDWLAVAAQAYQESGLDHSTRSKAGAIGIMQLLPATAADPSVGIPNIEDLESNIHAGVKYLDFLRDRYFSDEAIAPDVQVDFAWAAYNAGPGKIRALRKKTEQNGLDPNQWFGSVERFAPAETVRYVANINKYYIAYHLWFDKLDAREAAKQEIEADG